MTVKVRPYKRGGWEIDIMLTIPGRPRIRERRKAPMNAKSAAKRWGEERERQLIQHYTATPTDEDEADRPDLVSKEIPTLAKFIPRYVEGHCKANRLRPSTIAQRLIVYQSHLIPAFGRKRLDRFTAEDIQRFKAERSDLKGSTVNLMLTLLRCILNVAVEWKVIQTMPVRIKMLKEPAQDFLFYDFEEFDRLVLAAEQLDTGRLLVALLGGEAGLRRGEIIGLRWSDVDFERETLTVARSIWRGHEGPPKGGRSRTVPLAPRLKAALQQHRHLRGPWVLHSDRSPHISAATVRKWLADAQIAAGFEARGPHGLRHTFCSHLAMQGAPVRVIQELAGHATITTTERYMHLAPAATRDAVRLLTRPSDWRHVGAKPSTVVSLLESERPMH